MKKKIIVTIIILAILIGGTAGGLMGYKNYQKGKLVADVVSVESLNWGYWGNEMTSYGRVTSDAIQQLSLDGEMPVAEMYVEDGQTVEIGDKLLAYDVTMAELNLEMQRLEVQRIENDIASTQKNLNTLKNTTPIVETIPEEEPTDEEEEPEVVVGPEKDGEAYNYISETAKAYNKKADGSEENPYKFVCAKDAFVYGSYLNMLKEKGAIAIFEIHKGNVKTGKVTSSWTVDGNSMVEVDPDSRWSVADRQEVEEEILEPEEEEEFIEEPEEPEGYTAEELKAAIADAEAELKSLDIEKRKAELELKSYEDACEDGIVYATVAGTVSITTDEESYSDTQFLSISASEGLYVTGDISEMLLGDIKVGQEISATSWESGQYFTAVITEISPYPQDNSEFYGEGNPNASYYPFTAYIEDANGLRDGEYIDMSMNIAEDSGENVICIEKAFVRQENGRSYVMVENKDGYLEKRYISTGKTVYGDAIIIKAGLKNSDYIAFPYGKTAKEGVKCNETDSLY